MKLNQKLAVVLASAMVMSAVPVVTMAASTNSLTKETLKVAEDTVTTSNSLKVDFKDNNGEKEAFYLKLTNSTWAKEEVEKYNAKNTGITYEYQNPTTVKVTVSAEALAKSTTQTLPILATVTGGDATVEIVTMGGNTTISTGSFVFATTSDAHVEVAVDAKKLPNVYMSGKVADVVITETMTDAFKNLTDNTIELEVANSDYKFGSLDSAELTYEYGFSGQNNTVELKDIATLSSDQTILTIKLPTTLKSDGIGQLRIKGLAVKATTKTPAEGVVTFDVYGDALEAKTTLEVAKVSSYGSELTIDEDQAVEITAGQSKDVVFTLNETEPGSFVDGREVEFTIDKGYIMPVVKTDENKYDENATIQKLNDVVTLNNTTVKGELEITDAIVKDNKVVGFTAEMVANNDVDSIEVKMPVSATLQEEGDVTVKIAGRAIEEEVSAVITKINPALTVKSEAANLEVGVKGQTAGTITLTEANKAMFGAGKDITITIPSVAGITITDAPTVTVVNGDITMGEATVETVDDTTVIKVPVKRASRTASTIEIKGIGFTVNNTVAEGTYDVVLGGSALSKTETMTLEDFLAIGETGLAANGLTKGTSTFVIGENKYTVNGVVKEMDAKSYIQDPGYTMVPMRYVAEAFGIKGNDILFSNGTATIFAGNRTIQLTNGSDVAVVNGVQIKMATKVVMKEGRTYAPIGEVAQLLGVSKAWDNTTKTATFTNN